MGKFHCPNCDQVRHIEEDSDDPRKDHCWKCGTLVPYTSEQEADWREAAEEGGIWPGLLADETFAKDPKSELPIRTNSPQWKESWGG